MNDYLRLYLCGLFRDSEKNNNSKRHTSKAKDIWSILDFKITQGLNQDLPHCRRIEFFAKFGFSVVAAVLLSNQDSSLVLYLCALDKWEGNGGG